MSDAELAYLLRRFDPAELYQYEQEREHSIALLQEWLAKYKFKDWHETETRKLPVTPEMREERAKEIAEKLNDTALWHSHGRGISMEVLRRVLNLKIEDFGKKPAYNGPIQGYYRLLLNYMEVKSCRCLVHVKDRYRPLM